MKNQYTKRKIGGYMVENITMVKGTDGPTAVFLAGKNHRYTLRQKIKKYIFNRKMKFVEKSLKLKTMISPGKISRHAITMNW